jgi:hypothetical protein
VKRLALLIPLLLVVVGLSSCSDGDDAVVTVNGEVVLSQSDWEDEVQQIADSTEYLDAFDARGDGGDGTVGTQQLTSVLSNHVFAPLVAQLVEDEGIEVTDQDRETGDQILTSVLASPPQESGNAPIALEDMPERYADLLSDIYANFTAGLRHFGATPEDQNDPNIGAAQEQFNTALSELREAAEVEISPRYGSWNAEQSSVDPPEGPVSPSTTVPVLVGAQG